MKEQGSPPGGRKVLYAFAIIGAAVLLLIVTALAKVLVGPGAKALLSRFAGPSAAPHFTQNAWARRQMQELSLEAPFDFGPGPDVTAKIPPQVRQAIEYLETYQSRGPTNTFVVMISRLAYQAEIETDLDGAVHGAMTQSAAALGDRNPQYPSSSNSISGLEARRASYNGQVSGGTMHVGGALAGRGPKCWQVQVIYTHVRSGPDATRLLNSSAINP